MSQAANWGMPTVGPFSPTAYATRHNDIDNATLTQHSDATARPSYAVAGMNWLKTVSATQNEVYHYDGSDDILLYTVNYTANSVVWNGAEPANADILKADETDAITVGFTGVSHNLGNINSATTLHISDGNFQHGTVTGAFTLTAPDDTDEGYINLELTIDATGGYAITLAGFDNEDGTIDNAANAYNKLRIEKTNSKMSVQITQVP